jgi:hypothetical protein
MYKDHDVFLWACEDIKNLHVCLFPTPPSLHPPSYFFFLSQPTPSYQFILCLSMSSFVKEILLVPDTVLWYIVLALLEVGSNTSSANLSIRSLRRAIWPFKTAALWGVLL